MIELAFTMLCLTLTSYHEARSETALEQEIVAHVVMNRAVYREKAVCDIVKQPAQFSWVVDGKSPKPNTRNPVEEAAYKQAHEIAWKVYTRKKDITNGANHFWANTVGGKPFTPRWAKACKWTKKVGKTSYCLIENQYVKNFRSSGEKLVPLSNQRKKHSG